MTTTTSADATTFPSDWEVPSFDLPHWLGRDRRHCVIIPVINEGERIQRLLGRMQALNIAAGADILIVDGGSTDGSLAPEVLQRFDVRGLIVKTGPGKLSAQLRCAYAFALQQGYEGLVTIDGNDKDDPEAIPSLIRALEQGVDFVQGSRFVPGGIAEHTPLVRWLAIRVLHAPLLSAASGGSWTDTTQGFRAYSRRFLLDPRVLPFRSVFAGYELLAYLSFRGPQLGFQCIELPTARRYPADGKIPTKISALRGNLNVLGCLFRACAGLYNPPVDSAPRV